jgi:hypothetical protein
MILDVAPDRGRLPTMLRSRPNSAPALALSLSMAVAALGACAQGGPGAEEPVVVDTSGGERGGRENQGEAGEPGEAPLVVGSDACTTDADCVPAACCHATACVGRASAPACGDAMCTMDCQFGTIDCGGGCLCHQGRCAARLMPTPDLPAESPGGASE